jgi:hypothetical protein
VAPVASRLAELGVDAYFVPKVPPGENFGMFTRARFDEAKAALVCWSPAAIASTWVDAEADSARRMGTYVPVKVSPCDLEPPFNRLHTPDLSNWTGAANDLTWLKVVDRIAKLIGREGVAAAAHGLAARDEKTRHTFVQAYSDETAAVQMESPPKNRHLFISYCSEDESEALSLVDEIEKTGRNVGSRRGMSSLTTKRRA